MRMPGFTAEGSLYNVSGRSHGARRHRVLAASQGVSPQLTKQGDDCYAWCYLNGEDPLSCFFKCGSGSGGGGGTGGGGGGVGGGIPGESCGKCITFGPHKGQQRCTIPGRGSYYTDC